jgi:hypothetical protein
VAGIAWWSPKFGRVIPVCAILGARSRGVLKRVLKRSEGF